MDPVTRGDHNFIYKGPTPDIGDLSCFREPHPPGAGRGEGEVWSHWKPSAEELRILNDGGHVALGIFREPIPPVAMGVIPAEGQGAEGETCRNTRVRSPARLADAKPGPPQPPDHGRPRRHA